MKYTECNLCQQVFVNDDLIDKRKSIHERWHKKTKIEKRNTVEGDVIWKIY